MPEKKSLLELYLDSQNIYPNVPVIINKKSQTPLSDGLSTGQLKKGLGDDIGIWEYVPGPGDNAPKIGDKMKHDSVKGR